MILKTTNNFVNDEIKEYVIDFNKVISSSIVKKPLAEIRKEFSFQVANTGKKSGGRVNVTEFFHRATTIKQLHDCADILTNCGFYISHTENQGSALYSELLSCIDRITGNRCNLLKDACDNYKVYKKSLVDITHLLMEKHSNDKEVVLVLRDFLRCLR